MFRIYLRDNNQQVSEKTNTGDPNAALSAFETLVNRTDLDGKPLLAVLNQDGKSIAYHSFQLRPDGSPIDPSKNWRGRIDQIEMPGFGKVGRPKIMEDARRRNISIDDASWEIAQRLGDGNASEGIRKALAIADAAK